MSSKDQKIVEKLASRLMRHPAMGSLQVDQVGAMFMIAGLFAACDCIAKVHQREIVEMLGFRGVEPEAAQNVVASLARVRMLMITPVGFVTVPAFEGARLEVSLQVERRKEGWQSRRTGTGRTSAPVAVPQAPMPSALASPATAVALPFASESKPATLPTTPTKPAASGPDTAAAHTPDLIPPLQLQLTSVTEKSLSVFRVSAGSADSSLTVASLPCMGNYVAEVSKDFADSMKAVYPNIDAQHELRKSALWLAANGAKQKKYTGIKRFINAWLARAAEKASLTSAVLSVEKSRNGFGASGTYINAVRSPGTAADDNALGLADLSELSRAGSSERNAEAA